MSSEDSPPGETRSAPLVSVIVPAFNAGATLADCLASLVDQTLDRLEVIVVDDGSVDDTAEVARDMSGRHQRPIRLVQLPVNEGLAAARNRGIAAAHGDYIGFVDADDLADPRMYERLYERATATGADVVVCEYASFDDETGRRLHHYREGRTDLYGGSLWQHADLLRDVGPSACNKLVRRTLYADCGITYPEGLHFEDLATTYRIFAEAKRIEKVSEILYLYRRGMGGSIMDSCDERYLE